MKYRPEIDGLRALAVLPVILFHAGFEWFGGGFVGVDVFFVISGYLITTIIISEMAEGKFTILNFYERRARRILPAMFFVMLVCMPFAWLWLAPSDLEDFGQSLIAVSTFSSNIFFWRERGYFDVAATLKPLLHTWSLAVEEQYYILFPVFLLVTWRLGLKWILSLLAIVFVISLGVAHWAAYNNPGAAFYLLPTRGWELLIGVFAAFYLKHNSYLKSHTINQALSLIGFGMIVYAIVAFDETTPFPSLYALIPTIGTVLLILSAVPNTFVHKLLSFSPIVGVGLISYSAYLWHQPILAFARHRLLAISDLLLIILCLSSLIMAYISWRGVEKPFRDKNKVNRKVIFSFSIFAILVFTSIGLLVHLNGGFSNIERYKAQTAKYSLWLEELNVKNYVFNNKELQRNSYDILREITKDPSYGAWDNDSDKELWFDNSDPRRKILLLGNSHSKDLFNVFYNSKEILSNFQIARYGIKIRLVDDEFFNSQNYQSADYIMIVNKYSSLDLIALPSIINSILLDGKKVFLTYESFRFSDDYFESYNLADFVKFQNFEQSVTLDLLISKINNRYSSEYFTQKDSNNSEESCERTRQYQECWGEKIQQINRIAETNNQIILLNRMDYICDNDAVCFGVDNKGLKTFFDYGHHTLSGAKFFGRKLHDTNFYRSLISSQ